MTIKFNAVNTVTQEELENECEKPYIEYMKEMDGTFIGYADGSNVVSDSTFYKEILEALGGRFSDEEYSSYNINWFEEMLTDLPWFEDNSNNKGYKNYVLVVSNYDKILIESPEKKYIKYYKNCLENAVNWWTNDIITYMVGGPNCRKNFTILLIENK
ncbi:barstar family protein [Lactococcus lactis]|uniref:Barstar (barnase inhibitor) domain-containing protein n=1 Tax=Lactococcus lactis subsp. lactis TaxID=1360 RepID=A0A0V8E504_LACLL|nr:barstar family protein [Lactococcus lactis]KSU20712.1 hypothetical protein M20_1342 [Lactococcus lactis subsp. lactis]